MQLRRIEIPFGNEFQMVRTIEWLILVFLHKLIKMFVPVSPSTVDCVHENGKFDIYIYIGYTVFAHIEFLCNGLN